MERVEKNGYSVIRLSDAERRAEEILSAIAMAIWRFGETPQRARELEIARAQWEKALNG